MQFKSELTAVQKRLATLIVKRDMLEDQLQKTNINLSEQEARMLSIEKTRLIVQAVATEMQSTLEFRITNIVTMALASVFPDPYEFKAKFVDRRNQTEVDFFFVKDGNECDPMDSSGGGAIDIASLALRMAIWSIKKTRAVQILDEPAKFLSRDLQDKCSEMVKMLSTELGIQMIIVSHIPEMITAADKVFHVDNVDGYSIVSEV